MSSRRFGLPSIAPSSAIVEFHEFGGRWFVTDRWGSGSGVEVKRNIRKSSLGKQVRSRIWAARSEWRSARSQADEYELWARFCETEAGVPVNQYRPEKRIVILAGQAGIRWHDAQDSPPQWQRLPDRTARALGKALIKRITGIEPSASSTLADPNSSAATTPADPNPSAPSSDSARARDSASSPESASSSEATPSAAPPASPGTSPTADASRSPSGDAPRHPAGPNAQSST
jgi:hypothetical protein